MPTAISQRHLSQIAPLIIQSEIRSMSVECEGVGCVNLAQGGCDTGTTPASVAGSAFFASGGGENLLRFCFGKQHEALDRACSALREF